MEFVGFCITWCDAQLGPVLSIGGAFLLVDAGTQFAEKAYEYRLVCDFDLWAFQVVAIVSGH